MALSRFEASPKWCRGQASLSSEGCEPARTLVGRPFSPRHPWHASSPRSLGGLQCVVDRRVGGLEATFLRDRFAGDVPARAVARQAGSRLDDPLLELFVCHAESVERLDASAPLA